MKKVGIVGGVGPEASNKFCEMLIKQKRKVNDQDNIPFIHYCNPQIPDRTEYILGIGEDPRPELIKSCLSLQAIGADLLVIPCNTAHVFLKDVQDSVAVPIIDMTKVLVKKVITDNPGIKKIGLLATTGSIKSELFQNYFEGIGVETIIPNERDQDSLVMKAIYGEKGIKAGKKICAKRRLMKATQKLIDSGAEAIILGCTEIPLVLFQKDFDTPLYDPMNIVANEIINYVESEEKEVVTVEYTITIE